MPVLIVPKQKTEAVSPARHPALVPLRVTDVGVIPDRFKPKEGEASKWFDIGDILVNIPHMWGENAVFNCSKNVLLHHDMHGYLKTVRAYEVEQIIITNDNTPAPVL